MIARTAREETLHDRVASQFPVRTVARSPLAADAGFDADEQKLVEGCRRGDPEAFRSLVVHNGGRMLAAARRMLASDEDARDVVQDAFLYAFRAIDGFQATSRVSTWLHRILVNAALMKLRTRRRRPEQSIDDLLPHFDDAGSFPVAPEAAETADVLLERREIRVAVRRAIDALPESYRTVLLLRDFEELDTDDTARALGITPSAVKTRLHRARQALRTLVQRELRTGGA